MRVEICLFAGESRFGCVLQLNLCFRVVEHTAVAMLYPVILRARLRCSATDRWSCGFIGAGSRLLFDPLNNLTVEAFPRYRPGCARPVSLDRLSYFQ